VFRDRTDAGERLARAVADLKPERPLVLALPRGGLPVAERVAAALGAPLDVLVVRKIGAPGNPEAAIGATTAAGPALFDEGSLVLLGLNESDLAERAADAQEEARHRLEAYRRDAREHGIEGRDVIVVDDGLATGMSARAAVTEVRERGAASSIVLAVPVGAPEAVAAMEELCDRVVCLSTPPDFRAVSLWYERFPQVDDVEASGILRHS
jgi:predicted phosphoribosyltransferase